MSLTLTPLSAALGAQIEGVDLTQPLSIEQREAIEQALLTHHVIFFRNQSINPQQQARFAANFGDLHIHPIYPNIPEQPEVLVLDTAVTDVRDNAIWHTDVTFLPTPALGAVLSAKLLPAFGGDTLWASGIAAYEALSEPMKIFLTGLTATHDFTRSFPQERYGNTAQDLARWEEARKKNPPLSHPVIRTHPVSGRKSLFVSEGFTTRIVGLPEDESRQLLAELYAYSVLPENIYRHQWQPHDLVFWDNRSLIHLAAGCPSHLRRKLYRTTIQGNAPY